MLDQRIAHEVVRVAPEVGVAHIPPEKDLVRIASGSAVAFGESEFFELLDGSSKSGYFDVHELGEFGEMKALLVEAMIQLSDYESLCSRLEFELLHGVSPVCVS